MSAFAEDARYQLELSGLVHVDRVRKTGSQKRALEIHASASGCARAVAAELERVWKEAPLGYGGAGDRFVVNVSARRVDVSFVADGGAALQVTGQLLVVVAPLSEEGG